MSLRRDVTCHSVDPFYRGSYVLVLLLESLQSIALVITCYTGGLSCTPACDYKPLTFLTNEYPGATDSRKKHDRAFGKVRDKRHKCYQQDTKLQLNAPEKNHL